MLEPTLRSRLLAEFDAMPRRIRMAAQWVLDNPRDVALLSMREQARKAGVAPASMTRLAQRMGFDGYDSLRGVYAERIRRGEAEFSSKAEALLARRQSEGDGALAFDLAETLSRHMQALATPAVLDSVAAAAGVLSGARRIYVLGFRSSYPVACHFAYVHSLAGGDARLLDAPGGTGADRLRDAGHDDAMLAISVKPYTRSAVELVDYGRRRGLAVVALTDSLVSPLVNRARTSIVVPTASPSFFHTMTPAFATVEALAAMLAAAAGEQALEAVREMEQQFEDLSTHI
ncbi:MAG TPA: MurR/RpiR family transcriptional regulator [Rhizobiaceae bacterium]|nr:MurR/RpiR family transcriptional regulator [Rhizobiaceae bacterium]